MTDFAQATLGGSGLDNYLSAEVIEVDESGCFRQGPGARLRADRVDLSRAASCCTVALEGGTPRG